jgi:hypothetical protein
MRNCNLELPEQFLNVRLDDAAVLPEDKYNNR